MSVCVCVCVCVCVSVCARARALGLVYAKNTILCLYIIFEILCKTFCRSNKLTLLDEIQCKEMTAITIISL